MADWRDNDYTKNRNTGVTPYEIDDLIGREDSRDKVNTTFITVSGTASLLPPLPLGRRNYIKVKNLDGSTSVSILDSADTTYSGGYILVAGGEWEDNTDAVLYITTLAGSVNVQVYERSSRFNYR